MELPTGACGSCATMVSASAGQLKDDYHSHFFGHSRKHYRILVKNVLTHAALPTLSLGVRPLPPASPPQHHAEFVVSCKLPVQPIYQAGRQAVSDLLQLFDGHGCTNYEGSLNSLWKMSRQSVSSSRL